MHACRHVCRHTQAGLTMRAGVIPKEANVAVEVLGCMLLVLLKVEHTRAETIELAHGKVACAFKLAPAVTQA